MRVLIVKTSALGDVVQAFPVVEYLKNRQHVSTVGWVVENRVAPLVHAHPHVDTVIEIDSNVLRSSYFPLTSYREWQRQRRSVRSQEWDIVFDLQGNCKSGLVTWSAKSPVKVGYGRQTVAELPNILTTNHRYNPPSGLSTRDEYIWLLQQYFKDTVAFSSGPVDLRLTHSQEQALHTEMAHWPLSDPVWFVAVGSNWPNKMCKTTSLLALLQHVRREFHPYFIFVAGTGEELNIVGMLGQAFPHSSHILYRPELSLLQRAIANAAAVLSVDSLVLHLAATTKTPTFSFFGPSNAAKYAPNGPLHGSFQSSCPNHNEFEKRCAFLRTCPSGDCLKGADPALMFQAVLEWQYRVSKTHLEMSRKPMHACHWCFHP